MTEEQYAAMRADRDAGTPGDFYLGSLLTNDGSVAVMASDIRVALVDCQTEFKRGNGWKTACAYRDANARRIARVPALEAEVIRLRALVDELKQEAESNRCHQVELSERME